MNVNNSQRLPVSVMILTYNEESNISECLRYLEWTDDVIVIDSFSTDTTLEVARRMRPDVRIFQNRFEDFGQQRNWALKATYPRHDWVLFLDADERCNQNCADAIGSAVANPEEKVGFYLTCRNYFLGRWIKHCTMYPSWQLRLLKYGKVSYLKEGHGQREVANGPLGYLDAPYDHYGFSKGMFHWIERHNKYSSDEVELIFRLRREPLEIRDLLSKDLVKRRRCLKRIAAHVGFRPLFRFFYIYLWRGGFLDGRAGLIFSSLRVAQEIHISTKLAEAEFLKGAEQIFANAGSSSNACHEFSVEEGLHQSQFNTCSIEQK